MVHQEQITFQTGGHRDMHDLTDRVVHVVNKSGIQTGVAQVFAVGSTSAVSVVEFEPGLARDVPEMLDRLIPPSREYGHEQAWHDGNGHSHCRASLLGPDISIPIVDGQLTLGTWQQVIFLELDNKPHDRRLIFQIIGY